MQLKNGYRRHLIDDTCRYVRIPSRSLPGGGEEGELQAVISHDLRRLGARVRTISVDDVPGFREHPLCCGPHREYRNRPTVVAETGPPDAPALLVLAHSDTVEIFRPDDWTFDPYCGEVRDGRVCGLGASDDKWGLATMVTVLRALRDVDYPLRKRLIFASTMDEENGVGNGTLLLMLAGVEAETALYLDGGEMKVCIGNLGGSALILRPREPMTAEALDADFQALDSMCRQWSAERRPLFARPFFDDNPMRGTSILVLSRSHEATPFLHLPFYTLPGESGEAFCAQLEARLSATLGPCPDRYHRSYQLPWFEPARIPEDTPIVRHMATAVHDVLGRAATITTISKQDSFVLSNHAGIPTVAFGPRSNQEGRGASHQPDEFIDTDELWDAACIACRAITGWLEER